jgi:hypothetical protein
MGKRKRKKGAKSNVVVTREGHMPPPQRVPHRRFVTPGRLLALGSTLAGLILSGLALVPHLSCSIEQPLDEAVPFSAPVVFSNDGYLPLRDLRFTCSYTLSPAFGPIHKEGDKYAMEGLLPYIVGGTSSASKYVGDLGTGSKTTSPCHDSQLQSMLKDPIYSRVKPRRMEVEVQFRLYGLPVRRTKLFRFMAASAAEGKIRWLPQVGPATRWPMEMTYTH